MTIFSRWRFDRVGDGLLILTCVALLGAGAHRYFVFKGDQPGRSNHVMVAGEPFRDGRVGSSHKRTVAIYALSTCRFCTDSMPFYKSVIENAARLNTYDVMFLTLESPIEFQRYLSDHGLPVTPIETRVTFGSVRATPTLIVIDERGVIQGAWVGKLKSDEERAVRALLDIP